MIEGVKPKEGRFARQLKLAREIRAEPRKVLPLARGVLLDVWRARGGGFYGLGYIVAFGFFEVQMFLDDLASWNASEFAFGALFQYLIRFGVLSFVNVFQALLWPVYVLQLDAGLGIIVLIAGYFAFERLIRPAVEAALPELREHRQQREDKKASKRRKSSSHQDSGIPPSQKQDQ